MPHSPQKRKFSEFHDPDYPTEPEQTVASNNEQKRFRAEGTTEQTSDNCTSRLRAIITREFEREISFKQQQLEQIYERISKARTLLDRIRYAVVADYYRKQEVQLSQKAVANIRNNQTLFPDDEPLGPQLALHPSLKKIVGKKPRSYDELLRSKPQRTAAKNAKTAFVQAKTLRKEEKRRQELIRRKGIVIDHCKQEIEHQNEIKVEATNVCAVGNQKDEKNNVNATSSSVSGISLNKPRLNNKTKYLIVVGNTSKYTAAYNKSGYQDQSSSGPRLTHKWLVYVQAKDPDIRLENFVKKVRFFLHASYRPNDIVDICSPPFQVARRGWGDFPMRLQLFFDESLQQKPVQLVHNLVLDKTHSGFHCLGAETLVEIWLRYKPPPPNIQAIANIVADVKQKDETEKKPRTISFTQNKEELEDNLFAFLNKFEETPTFICADIEKIQPTVMVTEPLVTLTNSGGNLDNNSPKKQSVLFEKRSSQKKLLPQATVARSPGKNSLFNDIERIAPKNKNNKNQVLGSKSRTPKLVNANSVQTKPIVVRLPTALGMHNSLHPGEGTTSTSSPKTSSNPGLDTPNPLSRPQRRNVHNFEQPVDVDGKLNRREADFNGSNLGTTINEVNSSTLNNFAKKLNRQPPKNIVFQKEGILYIIDPLQMRLKQKQKKQVSLLKPQVRLLKQREQQQENKDTLTAAEVVASDHDYIRSTVRNPIFYEKPEQLQPSVATQEEPQRISIGPRQTRANMNTTLGLMEQKRTQMLHQFYETDFTSMRSAVVFLLRRIPLIANQNSVDTIFPFMRNSARDFESLPGIKQNAMEWLRSKYIAQKLRHHKDLQQLDAAGVETYWSTKEITIFARYHAYTPIIRNTMEVAMLESTEGNPSQFTDMVKNELKNEEQIQYETLTANDSILNWVNNTWSAVQDFEDNTLDNQTIDIVGSESGELERDACPRKRALNRKLSCLNLQYNGQIMPTKAAERLRHESDLVGDICRDLSIRLQPEEVCKDVWQPLTQIVLAQSLHLFVEKLVRISVAGKLQQQRVTESMLSKVTSGLVLNPEDIHKTITQSDDFDFLTNLNCGVVSVNESDTKQRDE